MTNENDDELSDFLLLADVEVRFGAADLELVLENLDDAIVNEIDDDLAPRVREQVFAHAKEASALLAKEEATWTDRTANDRIDDAIVDLASNGALVNRFASLNRGGGWHERMTSEPWEVHADAKWVFDCVLTPAGDRLEAEGRLQHVAESRLREVEIEKAAAEVVRIFRHHGVDAAYDAERRVVRVAPFLWQVRRTTKAPAPASRAPAPPVETVCPTCNGKGWVVKNPHEFPAMCVCKGGPG